MLSGIEIHYSDKNLRLGLVGTMLGMRLGKEDRRKSHKGKLNYMFPYIHFIFFFGSISKHYLGESY